MTISAVQPVSAGMVFYYDQKHLMDGSMVLSLYTFARSLGLFTYASCLDGGPCLAVSGV